MNGWVSGVPMNRVATCPLCQTPLESYWGKRKSRFNIFHSRTDCAGRFAIFGTGETEDEAWMDAEEKIREFNQKLAEQSFRQIV